MPLKCSILFSLKTDPAEKTGAEGVGATAYWNMQSTSSVSNQQAGLVNKVGEAQNSMRHRSKFIQQSVHSWRKISIFQVNQNWLKIIFLLRL